MAKKQKSRPRKNLQIQNNFSRLSSLSSMLKRAFQYHQAGNLQQAEVLYRQILQQDPHHAEAWHLLGLIARQVGREDIALLYFGKAIAIQPTNWVFHNNIGEVYRALGRLEEAAESHQQALSLNPTAGEAYNGLGSVRHAQGRLEEAMSYYQQALCLKPDSAEVYNNLGAVLRDQGKLDEAMVSFQQALQLRPNFPEACANRGLVLQEQGKLEEAVESFRQALQLRPYFPEAYANLGLALRAQGKLEEAVENLQQAVQLRPRFPEAHANLGLVLQEQGRYEEAQRSFQQALQLKPDFAEVYNSLGNLCQAQGKYEEAVESYRQALQHKPDCAETYSNLGALYGRLGKFDQAVSHLQQALQLKPDFVEAFLNLGNILQAKGKISEAVAIYHHALQLKPDSAEVHNNLGTALQEQGNLDKAMTHFQQALCLKPDYAEALSNMGNVLRTRGRLDEALESYHQALQLKPDCVEALIGEVNVLERKAEFQQAYERLRPLIESGRDEVSVVTTFATLCRRFNRHTEALAMMERCLGKNNLSANERRVLLFALGKLCDELKEFDKAFHYYHQANALKPRHFDPDKHAAFIDALITTYSADFFARMPRPIHHSERPVFIVGMPRSGTSLVEQILASHPAVYGAGELRDIAQIVATLSASSGITHPYPSCVETLTQDMLETLAGQYLQRLTLLSSDAARVTDKMPGNFLHLGLIALLFPQAHIIHCMRNPFDTCLSCYFQDFTAGHTYTYDLTHLGFYYRQYQKLMQHWRSVLDVSFLEVQYEELISQPEEVSQRMVTFCGLEWDEGCLQFHKTKRLVHTASYDQVRRPLYRTSVHRYRHYESYLEPLKTALMQEDSYTLYDE